MPSINLGQKSARVLRLLQGLADRRAATQMRAAGFSQEDLDEGWKLLREASAVRYARTPTLATPRVVSDVDAWENYWFPIIDATLRRRSPAVHERVFLNLKQESGAAVLVSVRVLLDRLDELRKAKDEESKTARAVLETRGLDAAALDEVRGYLDQAATFDAPDPDADAEEAAEAQAAAEEAMWAWYREWSQIARTVVTDGRALVALGLITVGRPRGGEEPSDEPNEPAVPAAAPVVAPVNGAKAASPAMGGV
jgi:hypothetical protein